MTEIIKDLSDKNLKLAAQSIRDGRVVVFPTETVYGIGAHVFNKEAIDRIYEIKKRDRSKGLIVHISKLEDVKKIAKDIPDEFYLLAKAFFPGPLSIILKKKDNILSNISSDDTVAIRMPDFDQTRKLIDLVGDPIVGTSANISDNQSLVDADEIFDLFENQIDLILDGGVSPIKRPSTIINLTKRPFEILREGSVSRKEIDEILKKVFT